jgi:hypothetical protein
MMCNTIHQRGLYIIALAIMCILCLGAFDSSAVSAQKTKPASYGALRIQSNPSGLAVEVDGVASGVTSSSEDLTIERLAPGAHMVAVTLPDGRQWRREIQIAAGRLKCIAVAYRPPPPPIVASPCPYRVNIDAPTQVTDGTIVTYSANANYGGSRNLNYTWTVSPASAKIVTGAGSSRIEIDTTGLAGQRLTATLVVDDGSGATGCRQIVQAVTWVPPIERRERISSQFDVCCECASDDQKARLDNLAIALQNEPSTNAYILVYRNRNSRQPQSKQLLSRARDYLISQRGIDGSRIVTVEGGSRDENCVELWLVPQGAAPPVPKP